MLKLLSKNPGQSLVSLWEVAIVVAAFLVEYVVAAVVDEDLFEVDVAADADDLVAGVTAAVVVIVALADIVFDDDYIFFVLLLMILLSLTLLLSLLLLLLMMLVFLLLLMLMCKV